MERLTYPDRIRLWTERNYNPKYVEQVFSDLLEVATGNRVGTKLETDTLARIFPETSGRKPKCPKCGNTRNLETDRDEGNYSCERCEIVW